MTAITTAEVGGHHESIDVVGQRWRTGVLLLILADASFVVALIFAYFYLRGLNTEGNWLTQGAHTATIWVGWLVAAVLVAGAAAFRWGVAGLRAGQASRLVSGAGVAVLLVLVDAGLQLWQLTSFNFKPDANAYASSVYTLAGANLFHLLLTLFIGVGLWNRSRIGKYSAGDRWQVEIVNLWYIWVAVAALGGALTTSFIASPNLGH